MTFRGIASFISGIYRRLQEFAWDDTHPAYSSELVPVSFGDTMEMDDLLPIGSRKAYQKWLSDHATEAIESNPLALVVLDIDYFKSFNDNHGHTVGDTVLIEVAKVLQSVTNGKGAAFRCGGEELVMLLPNHTLGEAESVAERARRSIELIRIPGVAEAVTASFGVAAMPQTTTDVLKLFEQADAAMYKSKHDGRNRVTCTDSNGMSDMVPKNQRHSVELSLDRLRIDGYTYEPSIPVRWFMLGLRNSGTGLAKYPMIRFHSADGLRVDPYGVDGNRNFGIAQLPTDGSSVVFQGGANDVIAPNDIRQIAKLMQRGQKIAAKGTSVIDPLSNLWRALDRDTWVFPALTFSCEVSCEGATVVTNQTTIPEERVDV